MQIMYKMLR